MFIPFIIKKISCKSGFSLVEVLIGMGIMAAGSLAFMQMNQNQIVSQKRIEENVEVASISNLITQSLSSSESCLSTIGFGASINAGTSITSVKDISGANIIEAETSYGAGLVEVRSIQIVDPSYGVEDGGEIKGRASLEVIFRKINKAAQGKSSASRTIRKTFPFLFVADVSRNMISCYSSLDGAIDSSLEAACESLGGVLSDTNQCVLKPYNASSVSDSDAVSTSAQQDFLNTTLDPMFVSTSGDSMTGALNVTGNISTDSQICINGRCRDFAKATCPTGEVATEINTDGSFTCTNVKTVLAQALCSSGEEVELDTSTGINVLSCSGGCVPSIWSPLVSTKCTGESFVQTSDCNTVRSATGTKAPETWSPDVSTVCSGVSFSQTSDCGTNQTVEGTKTDGACSSATACTVSDLTDWAPTLNTVCRTRTVTQARSIKSTSDCVNSDGLALSKLDQNGTKICCRSNSSALGSCYDGDSDEAAWCENNCGTNSSSGQNVTKQACYDRSHHAETGHGWCDCLWNQLETCYSKTESSCNSTSGCTWSE